MNKILLTLLLITFSCVTFSQKNSIKFGKIDPELLKMTTCELDSSAGALIISDIGDVYINYDDLNGFKINMIRHLRVKVFNSTAFDLAKFKLKCYKSGDLEEKYTRIRAASYNLNESGKMETTELSKDNIFTDRISNKEKSYNFSVPNIREGSVFEVEYTLTSKLFWQLPEWEFQTKYPTLLSELNVAVPEYFIYKRQMRGYISPSFTESKKNARSILFRDGNYTEAVTYSENADKYVFINVPALYEEPFMNDISNYTAAIEFELAAIQFPRNYKDYTSSWDKIDKLLWNDEEFGVPLKRGFPLKKEAEVLKMTIPDPMKRMIAAHEIIRNSIKFDGRNSLYLSKSLNKVWENKTGKSSDINLLLISFLNECDIETHPVILSTRENGIINPAQIMLSKFNYVIAEAVIDSARILLDATDKKLTWNIIPEACQNGKGRRVSRDSRLNDWVDLNGKTPNEETYFYQVKMDSSGNIKGNFSLMLSELQAVDAAEKIRNANTEEDYINEIEASFTGMYIDNYTIENLDDRTNPLIVKMDGGFRHSIDESVKDVIFFNPGMGALIDENPFKAETRMYPIDFIRPKINKVICMISIPEGYEVAELPQNMNLGMSEKRGYYRYNIVVNGNNIQLSAMLNINSSLITYDSYEELRELFNRIVAKNNEMVVLKKI